MSRYTKLGLPACFMGFLVLNGATGHGTGQEKALASTTGIKLPAGAVVPPKPVPADFTKSVAIEPPALAVIGQKSTSPASPAKEFVNAHVPPGLVHWHATFAEACRAAQKSHKPVLLFHMMGKLDDLFC
jgi:hypothetical protein